MSRAEIRARRCELAGLYVENLALRLARVIVALGMAARRMGERAAYQIDRHDRPGAFVSPFSGDERKGAPAASIGGIRPPEFSAVPSGVKQDDLPRNIVMHSHLQPQEDNRLCD